MSRTSSPLLSGLAIPLDRLAPFLELVPPERQYGRKWLEYVASVDDLYRDGQVDLHEVWQTLVRSQPTFFETDPRDVRRVDDANERLRNDLLAVRDEVERALGNAATAFAWVREDVDALTSVVDRFVSRHLSHPRPSQPEVLRRARAELLALHVPVALLGRESRNDGPLLYPLRRQKIASKKSS